MTGLVEPLAWDFYQRCDAVLYTRPVQRWRSWGSASHV